MNPYELQQVHGQLNNVSFVEENSIAWEIGIEVGDHILSINGQPILDVVDYRYNISDPSIEILVKKKSGEVWSIDIEKESGEDIGISFADPLLDKQKRCSNQCIFCFIDQMPKGMRKSLYIKDDDSRLSFLQGNYITLTNLRKQDFDRIIEYKLSPINVSVHTTNGSLRRKMLKHPRAGKILEQLRLLTKNKTSINAQIVAIPGINDGQELKKTLGDLFELGEYISSVAVVPVGLTKFRKNLPHLPIYTKSLATALIKDVETFGNYCLSKRGFRWVYPSDEFYLLAKKEIPSQDFYEDYPQYENGVGLLRAFYEEAKEAIGQLAYNEEIGRIQMATGEYASPLLKSLMRLLSKKRPNYTIEIFTIKNHFFGTSVKVAGLLTAQDLMDQLKGKVTNAIIIPRVIFRQDKLITLDDCSIQAMEEELDCHIIPCENDGQIFIDKIMEVALNG